MSFIASLFVVTPAKIRELDGFAARKDYDRFWDVLHEPGGEVTPAFEWSGLAFDAVLRALEARGIRLESEDPAPSFTREFEDSFRACLVLEECDRLVRALEGVRLTEAEGRAAWEDFNSEPFPELPEAVREGLDLLARGARRVQGDERLLVFVG